MLYQLKKCELRGTDPAGSGAFGALRGARTHKGIDILCTPNKFVYPRVIGEISKLGWPYGGDLFWRYVEIKDFDGLRHRYFYVSPGQLAVGDKIGLDGSIGIAQDITIKYPDQGMQPHIHYEVIDKQGLFIDPATV